MATTEYRPTTLSPGELAFLGGEFAYPPSAGKVESIGEWQILYGKEYDSGLEIYAVQKVGTNEVSFAIRGTDAVPGPLTDWVGPNLAFSGSYHIQARQAIEFINDFIGDPPVAKDAKDTIPLTNEGKPDYTYSLAGHSKAGGINQLASYVFGFDGVAIDPAPASRVIFSPDLQQHLQELQLTPKGVSDRFYNIVEEGSAVGDTLQDLTVCFGRATPQDLKLFEALSKNTSLDYREENGLIYVGPGHHLGTTIRVNLADGSFTDPLTLNPLKGFGIKDTVSEVLTQHTPFDDIVALSQHGILGIKQHEIEKEGNRISELKKELDKINHEIYELEQKNKDLDIDANYLTKNQKTISIKEEIVALEKHLAISQQEYSKLWQHTSQQWRETYGDNLDPWMKNALAKSEPDLSLLDDLLQYQRRDAVTILEDIYSNKKTIAELSAERNEYENTLKLSNKQDGFASVFPNLMEKILNLDSQIKELEEQQADLQENLDTTLKKINIAETLLSEKTFGEIIETPLQFSLPNDPDIYWLYSDGRIVKTQAIAGMEIGESGIVLNVDSMPQSREELLSQLQNLGLSADEAEEVVREADSALADDQGTNQVNTEDESTGKYEEAQHKADVKAGENVRAADLQLMQAQNNFSDAISSGNTLEIVRAGLDYYSSLEKRADLGAEGRDIDKGTLSKSTEALVDSVASAIGLGQAIDKSDGLAIAGRSIELLKDIDCYLDEVKSEYGKVIGTTGSALLGLGAAGIGLAQAIECGNDLGIAKSSVELLEGIDNYIGGSAALDTALGFDAGDALKGIGSAIGLAINISRLDDVFESGDAGAIACSVASTASSAISTYNAVAAMAGASGIACKAVPALGFLTAGIQLMQGDVVGAVFSAASAAVAMAVACGLMSTGVGAIAGLAIMAIQMLISDDDPPEASAIFTLDEDGKVVMETRGDKAMQESAGAYASPMVELMENYRENGGRLLIDGSLPTLRVVQGESSTINYRSETGGRVAVVLDDMSQAMREMSAVLYARDRGERLDSAVEISRDSEGNIDLASVDRILAGLGFGKTGITYTYGETKELTGVSFGSGVFTGGGNVNGPEGQLFVAKDKDIKSLPLREDQRPAQTMGEIIKIVSLNNAFNGAGSELLAMALISGGLLGLSAPAGNAASIETDSDCIKPLDKAELEKYLQNPKQFQQQVEEEGSLSTRTAIPALTDSLQMQQFLQEHWGDLLRYPARFTAFNESAYLYRELSGYHNLNSDGSKVKWVDSAPRENILLLQRTAPQVQFAADDEHKNGHLPGESFTGYRVTESLTLGASGSASDPPPEPGLVFNMAEDSTLRFLLSELIEDTTPGSYGKIEEGCSFVSFGLVENGRIYQEENGDIRFEPTPGFVGTGSFRYTLKNSAGDLIEKHATVHVQNVNDTPLLQDDKFTLEEGEPFYLDSLPANDFDPDGDPLTLDHLRGLEHGKVSIVNGRLAFIPEEGYFGDIEFSYWLRDHAFAYPVMANATLHYLDRNTGVSTGDDRFIVLEDHSLTITVDKLLENDVEHDGENIIFTGLGAAVHGTVHRQPDGTILFTPEPDYAGTAAGFSYSVEDDSGNSSTGWVSVEVLDVREAPVVIAGTRAPILEDEILTFTPEEIAGFIYDADGDVLHLDFITNVVGGEIVTANGYYSFIPDRNFSGHASFDYRANDNHRGVVDGHLEFEILSVNDPIETGEDILDTEEDTPVTVHVDELLANDSDVDGSVFTFVALGKSVHGSAILNPDNTVVFTPDPDYAGVEAGFEYLVQDSEGLQSIGWVQVRVNNVNDAPEIIGQSLSLLEDQPLTFDAETLAKFIRDADNDELRITGVEAVSGGTVNEVDSVYTFIPDHNYHGGGSISLTVTDGKGESVATTLALDILSIDDPAVLGEDILTTLEEQSVNTNIAALLANDQDADGPLEFVGLGKVFHGTVLADDQGEIQFNPDKDYFGNEAGFEYIVKDPDGYEATGRVRIHVENVNDAPQIIGNTLRSEEDQPIVFNAATIAGFIADLDGDGITLTSVDDVSGGTLENNSGIYTFIPDKDYHGPAFLRYSAEDGHGGQVSGELNLEILSVDDPTIFGDNTFTTKEEQLLVTSIAELLKGDHDADGPLEFMGVGEARYGEVKVVAGGGIEFMPESDYFGDEAGFSYVVRDEEGYQATGWVTVKVENINDEPEIIANRLHLREDQSIIFTEEEVAKFLFDADGDFLHLDMVANVTGGRMEQNGNIYTFIPEDNFYGEASFDYLATNSSGEQIAGGLSIAISPVNDLPSTTYFYTAGIEDNEVTMTVADLMAGATDIEDGTNLRFAGIDSSLHGDVYVDDDGLVHFLPDKDFFGNAFFSYNVVDSEGGVGRGYVGIEIVGENDIPVAVDDKRIVAWSNGCYQNVYMASTLLANDYDVDGDPIKLIATGAAEYGTVSLDGEGNIHYIASSDEWVGVDRFSYEISDGNGGFATGTAEIDVKINTSPDVYSELLFTQEDIISILSQNDLLANDSDIDGDSLRIIAVDQAEHCSVSLLADGSLQFVPELNYNNNYPGQASFRYTVTDGISEPVTSVAFFDIDPINDKPILSAERIEGAVEDNSFSFTVAQIMANDTDVEMMSAYEEDSISFEGVWGAGHGSISWDVGSGIIYYTPDADFCGVETFNYMVVDSYGAESTITSEIYVLPVNDYPVVQEDIGSTAEDSIWNYYSIAGLLANDYDVDGDSLTAINPFVIEGRADVQISGDNLMVKPGFREDRVVIGYTVSDGHGGDVASKLTIPNIREHNYAPTFSGIYSIGWKNSYTVWFNFHAEDRNGGNTWGNSGDIVAISASAPNVGSITDEGYTFKFKGDTEKASLVLTAVDQAGATGSIYVRISNLSKVDGNYHYSPVVLDLDGDSIELLDLSAGVGFDWNLDGQPEATGWVGKDDGFLVYDYDHDRVVRYANELALKEYDPQAATDLEGLRAFDTNKDGVFDSEDAEWSSFGVWQDKNSDGKTDEGEFATLDELEIRSIDLRSDENFRELDGNIVYGSTTYQKMDGTTGEVGDVGLNGESLLFTEAEDFTGIDMPEEEDSPGESVGESPGEEPELLAEPPALQDITAPQEENEQVLETESLTTVESEEPEETEEALPFDDAEINRQCLQLLSDIAGCSECEPIELPSFFIDDTVPEYTASVMEIEQDSLAIA